MACFKPFFNPNMNKFTAKFNKYFASGFLAIILLSVTTPNANASILDWFKSSDTKTDTVQSRSNSSMAYVGVGVGTVNDPINSSDSVIVADKFLLATNSPVKSAPIVNSKLTNFNYFVTKEFTVPMSAYSSTPDQTDDSPFITANGAHVYDGLIAANFLPFGTKVKIPSLFGDKIFTVEDRMNKRYDKKIDIWFADRESALEFGLRTAKIQIVSTK
jgi:3D (Asp-Asp-Asp) domain-containing protein